MPKKKPIHTLAGFFAGVGGIEKGFELAGFKPIWANELDHHASKTFRLNHKITLHENDIKAVSSDEVPDVDVIARTISR